jgi:hypothetical protein
VCVDCGARAIHIVSSLQSRGVGGWEGRRPCRDIGQTDRRAKIVRWLVGAGAASCLALGGRCECWAVRSEPDVYRARPAVDTHPFAAVV